VSNRHEESPDGKDEQVSANPRVECSEHGWQDTLLVTRYERRSHPRDVPDYYICWACWQAKAPAEVGNSIRIGPNCPVDGE